MLVGRALLDFLLQSVKLRRVEKFTQGDSQPVADHFDGEQFGVLAFSVENILDAGRG